MSKNPHDSVHHRKCRSNGGSNDERNKSLVTSVSHQAWHTLFGNSQPETIVQIINKTWLDPDWEVVVRRRK